MCGIAIVRGKKKLAEALIRQKDRGLDGVGVITPGYYYRAFYSKIKNYLSYIKNCIREDSIYVLHHRKASIGAICFDNVHPFAGGKFILVQNGTAKNFYKKYKDVYKKETDTETLLSYLENKASSLEEIPGIMKELSEAYKEDFGIVIIQSVNEHKMLFYADGSRESYIDININNNTINGIYNYDINSGFENRGYLIFSYKGKVIKNTFESLNTEPFFPDYSGIQKEKNKNSTTDYGECWEWDYTSGDYIYKCQKKQTVIKKKKKKWNSDMYRCVVAFLTEEWDSGQPTEIQGMRAFYEWYYGQSPQLNFSEYSRIKNTFEKEFSAAYKKVFII